MEDLHITAPPKVECDEIPKVKLINYFYNVLKTNGFDTNILCENAKSLDIIYADKLFNDITGQYNMFTNEISMLKDKRILNFITHEFFHMASTIREDKKIYAGFMQGNVDIMFGHGLNEGYTQLLDERYFGDITPQKRDICKRIYPITKYIVSYIEDLVGKEFMENCYIHADLESLTMKLREYANDTEILTFVRNLDIFYNEIEHKVNGNFIRAVKAYDNCMLFISECYYYSLDKKYMENKITTDEYLNELQSIKHIREMRLYVGRLRLLKSVPLGSKYYYKLKNKVRSRLI